jgi:hypothetical protein
LFFTTTARAQAAVAAGITRLVVDLEVVGKHERQVGHDTQVNTHQVSDIVTVRRAAGCAVTCRVNSVGAGTDDEIEAVVDTGADEVLVPMAREVAEVERVLDAVGGRAAVAVMVETQAAVDLADALASLPVSRLYLGLLDLWIDRRSRHPFEALADGTIDRVAEVARCRGRGFGFGGLTLPGGGYPLPVQHLFNELSRTSTFTFLRRSFERDVPDADMAAAVSSIRSALEVAGRRPAAQVEADRLRARAACAELPDPPWS